MCYLPGQNTPERECWYINMGAVDKDFFTTEAHGKGGSVSKFSLINRGLSFP